jgi:hypothetical protein
MRRIYATKKEQVSAQNRRYYLNRLKRNPDWIKERRRKTRLARSEGKWR